MDVHALVDNIEKLIDAKIIKAIKDSRGEWTQMDEAVNRSAVENAKSRIINALPN